MTVSVHVHTPGARLHDDHICGYYRCLLCGAPIKELLGVWVVITI